MSDTPSGGLKIPASVVSIGAGVAVVLVGAWTLLGMTGKVDELQAELARVQLEVEELRDLSTQIDEMEDRIEANRESIADLANVRDDIAAAICEALGRDVDECGVT